MVQPAVADPARELHLMGCGRRDGLKSLSQNRFTRRVLLGQRLLLTLRQLPSG